MQRITQHGDLYTRACVDIHSYPEMIDIHPQNTWVTMGDLHGNAVKFLNMLVYEAVISISEKNYDSFLVLYDVAEDFSVSLEDYQEIKSILPHRAADNANHANLRVLGDDVADRGFSDAMILFIYRALKKLTINYEIILSNHSLEFLKQYAIGFDKNADFLYVDDLAHFGRSLHGLLRDINENKEMLSIINKIVESAYLPNLKLLSYEINSDNQISLFTHAPANSAKIKILAELFAGYDAKLKIATPKDLGKVIDAINLAFKSMLKSPNDVRAFIEKYGEAGGFLDRFLNDRYDEASLNRYAESSEPFPFDVLNFHGHVGEKELNDELQRSNWRYINMDNDLAKGQGEEFNNRDYKVYISQPPKFTQKSSLVKSTMFNQVASENSPGNRKLKL